MNLVSNEVGVLDDEIQASQTKQCSVCKEFKTIDEFSPDKRAKDCLASVCKECRNRKAQEIFDLRDKVGQKIRVWFLEKGYEEGTLAEVHPKYLVIRDVISANFQIGEIHVNVRSISRIWFDFTDTRKRFGNTSAGKLI